jgi:membrane-associated phospholipid phosphatase
MACGFAWHLPLAAQESDLATSSLFGRPKDYVVDFEEFMKSPAGWERSEWLAFGGVLAATSVAYRRDYDVRDHFVVDPFPVDHHDIEDLVPAAAVFGATWIVSKVTWDPERIDEAATMIRAAALSTASSMAFKLALGRARPAANVEHDRWLDDGRSMPSGHTALGFAVGTVFAESGAPKRRWARRVIGYGLIGVGTGYLRLKHDSHWLSDTIPGAALGIAAARFTMSHDRFSEPNVNVIAEPIEGGLVLTFARALQH